MTEPDNQDGGTDKPIWEGMWPGREVAVVTADGVGTYEIAFTAYLDENGKARFVAPKADDDHQTPIELWEESE